MVSATIKQPRRTPPAGNAERVFIEIRGDAPADLASLASVGSCLRCETATCNPYPVYLRISSDDFADDKSLTDLSADRGVVRQTYSLVRLVEDETRHVILFVDNDLSASKKRPEEAQWWKALAYVRENRPGKLLGLKYDRLGRRMADLEELEDICEAASTRVITLADGDLFANPAWPFLAAMAKTEARNTSWRVRQSQASRRAKGLDSGGGNRPFGYAANRLDVIKAEAETFRRMVALFLDGASGTEIAKRLNADGVRRAEGGTWMSGRVRETLANPRYAGFRSEGGTVVGRGAWPSLIDETTHVRVKERLSATANRGKGGRPVSSLLGGVARCGYCEAPLYAASAGSERRPTYKCAKESGGCGAVNRTRAVIDAYVTEHVLSLVNADLAANEAVMVREQVDAIQQARTDLDLRQSSNRDEYASGRLDAAAYYVARDAVASEARRLDKDWRTALAELDELSAETTAAAMWDAWTIDKRRRFIKSKLAAVLIYKAKAYGRAARVIRPGEIEIVTG